MDIAEKAPTRTVKHKKVAASVRTGTSKATTVSKSLKSTTKSRVVVSRISTKEKHTECFGDWLRIYTTASGIFSEGRTAKQSRLLDAYKSMSKAIYRASDMERVVMIRNGLPAVFLEEMGRTMAISNELLWTTLALPRSTVVRKIQKQEPLSAEQSERVIGLERLVGQVEEMVTQSGDATGFDAGRWLGEWLQRPLPALAGKKPAEFMDTMAGQNLLSKLLAQSQSGAYA